VDSSKYPITINYASEFAIEHDVGDNEILGGSRDYFEGIKRYPNQREQ
jgi:hypothetical protein